MKSSWKTYGDVRADIQAGIELVNKNAGYVPSPIVCIDHLKADYDGVILLKCPQGESGRVLDVAHNVARALPKSLVVLLPEPFDLKAMELSEVKQLRDKLNEVIYDKEQVK